MKNVKNKEEQEEEEESETKEINNIGDWSEISQANSTSTDNKILLFPEMVKYLPNNRLAKQISKRCV